MQEETTNVTEELTKDVWDSLKDLLNWGLHIGEGENAIHVTVGLLFTIIIAFIITSFLLKWFFKLITHKMDGEGKLKFHTIYRFIKYLVYIIVIVVTMSSAGIDITLLITASAVVFVGLGLALQDLFQDVIGGVFILIDKSLRAGDIIEVDGKVGKVFEIKLRTTLALTRDDKVIVIPNHKFINDIVYNYTQNHKTTREEVRVSVAYGSNVQLVTEILKEVANKQTGVLKNPKPFVIFEDFGESALIFSVNFYINDSYTDPKIKSDLRYGIESSFRANQIKIPFPQREVHVFKK